MKQRKRCDIKEEDTWDLTPIYLNETDFLQDYDNFLEEMQEINDYKNHLLDNSQTLLNFLVLSDKLERKLYRLYYYAHLNFDVDTTNARSKELLGMVDNLMVKYGEAMAFVDPELLKGNFSLIEKFLQEEPGLEKYRFNLENLYRYKKHTLTEKEEKIMNTLSVSLDSAETIYESLTDSDLTFGSIVVDSKKEEFTESNYSKFIESPDRKVRQKAFQLLFKTYAKYKNTLADTFRLNIESVSKISQLKHYNSSIEASLYHDNIDLTVYNNLISTVNNHLDILYKYYDLKKEVLGVEKLHLYDIYTNMVSDIDKNYTFDEAKNTVLEALSILGTDYQANLKKAFANRYIDIYNNKGKRGGAYSSGFYDTNPYILLNFEGKYNDVTTLAHELGHSMHTLYSCQNNPYNTSSYKIFVAEVASTVNELLLIKY